MRESLWFALVVSCLLPTEGMAQLPFDRMQATVLQASSEQWLCTELKAVNPSYFDCVKRDWTLPQPGMFALFDDSIALTSAHIARFQEVWFPRAECRRFLSVVAMADVYMPLFKRKAELLALHRDVAFLPVVLSGCNQRFVGGDGAGLWALPYLAARKQHLKIDTLVDERLGGDFTTDAALQYFKYMLTIQRQDYWRATVAYSFGASALARADTALKGAALADVLAADAADQLRFQAYSNELLRSVHASNQLNNCFEILGHFQPVLLEEPLQVKAIAAVLAIDEGRLRETNPVYTGRFLVPGYRRVPFVLEDTLLGRFTSRKDSIARWQPSAPKAPTMEWETYWVQHRVGKGETLGRIAGRYHVTISELKRWNKLRNDKIRKGQGLKIEQRRKVAREVPMEISDPMEYTEPMLDTSATRTAKLEQDTTVRHTPSVVRRTPAAQYYTVRKGDSLWSIAKKYPGTTEHDLMKWNKCGADIRPGQRLIIKK